jgi:hypothetical protein
MREINGTLYCNDGDWVESRTALVEHMDGRLELVYWATPPVSPVLQIARSMETAQALVAPAAASQGLLV